MNFIEAAFADAMESEASIQVNEWADKYRFLPQKSSAEPGRYRTSRTPYLREIMAGLSVGSMATEICVMKGTQLGFTEVGNNWFGYIVDVSPGPFLMVFPTETLAKGHSKQKLAPTIEETPRMKAKIKSVKKKETGNTILEKDFAGGVLFLSGANSPASFRSKPIRFLFLDDVDGYEADVGGEGDPAELAKKRTDTYSYRKKIYEVSTPTVKGSSLIELSFNESDQRYYNVPCPFCGEKQKLEWGGPDEPYGIKFNRDEHGKVLLVWYLCKFCGEVIDEAHKTDMLAAGEWIAEKPKNEKRGYHLSGLYSPLGWVSWLQIAKEFVAALGIRARMKVWQNTRLGEVYSEHIKERDEAGIMNLVEDRPRGRVPGDGQVACLVGAVDTQDHGFWYRIRAFGYGGTELTKQSWGIRDGFVTTFGALERVLWLDKYMDASGNGYPVQLAVQDALGHRTAEVYSFCLKNRGRIFPTFGRERMATPFRWTNLEYFPGTKKPIPGGLKGINVNTKYFKDDLSTLLEIPPADPGAWLENSEFSTDWARHMTAEHIDAKGAWVCPGGKQNHLWDCAVLALVAHEVLGVVHWPKPEDDQPAQNGRGVRSRGAK